MTKQPKDVSHLSHSSVNRWLQCPKSWAAHYLDERKSRPGVGLIKGKALDEAAEHNWFQKRESGTDLEVEVAQEIAEDAFRRAVSDAGGRTDVDWGNEGFSHALDSAIRMTGVHMRQHAPLYTPTATQHKFTRRLADGRDFIGFIDAVLSPTEMVDVKSGGRKFPQAEADRDGQATAYAFGMGRPVTFHFARVIDSGRTPVHAELVTTTRGDFARRDYEMTATAVSAAIDACIFPAHPGWQCSWCPIKDECVGALGK